MHATLALLSAFALTAAAPAQDPVLRIYDTRDLAAVLPASAQGGVISIVPRLEGDLSNPSGIVRLSLTPQLNGSTTQSASSADVVVSRLCDQLQLQKESLIDGVYIVTGEAGQHEQLVKLLEDVRSLYQGAYDLELFIYPMAAAQAPGLGAPADSQAVTLRARQVIARRVESRLDFTEELTYIRDWQPVVGNDSVGYDPDPATVTRGLRLTVTAGAVDREPATPGAGSSPAASNPAAPAVPLRLRGEWIDAVIERQSALLAPVSGGELELGLPHTTTRTIESDLRLPLGQPSVLAVIPGAKPGEVIVIAGAIRELK